MRFDFKKSLLFACFLILFSITYLINDVSAEFFTRYKKYKNLKIADQHIATLQVGESSSIANLVNRDSTIVCGVSCNAFQGCSVFFLNDTGNFTICSLFSDQVSLIHTENTDNILGKFTLLSKKPLSLCIDVFYDNMTLMNCFKKLSKGAICSSEEMCSNNRGLECSVNATCQCKTPDAMYVVL